MKKLFRSALYLLATLLIHPATSVAQTNSLAGEETSIKEQVMRYATSDAINNSATHAIPTDAVSAKALRSFKNFFKEGNNPAWYSLGKNYMAEFQQGSLFCRALFAKDGFMLYALSFGSEESLPAAVRRIVKSNYVDYAIGRTVKVTADGQTVWLVNVEDANNLVIVRANDQSFDELAHYSTKAPVKQRKGRIIIPE